MSARRRLAAINGALGLGGSSASLHTPAAALASAAAEHALAPRLDPANPRSFRPGEEREAAAFFEAYGFAVLAEALDTHDVGYLNDWYERSQCAEPHDWGCQQGAQHEWLYHQPLLTYPELDPFVRHAGHYPLTAALLGGEEHARFSEFDFRETPSGTGQDRNWHRDIGPHGFGGDDAAQRREYQRSNQHAYICSFHYLTDVTTESPSFGVIPQSCVFAPLPSEDAGGLDGIAQLKQHLGEHCKCLPRPTRRRSSVRFLELFLTPWIASTAADRPGGPAVLCRGHLRDLRYLALPFARQRGGRRRENPPCPADLLQQRRRAGADKLGKHTSTPYHNLVSTDVSDGLFLFVLVCSGGAAEAAR